MNRVIEHLKSTLKSLGMAVINLVVSFFKGFVAIGGSFFFLCLFIPILLVHILFDITFGWFIKHPLEK